VLEKAKERDWVFIQPELSLFRGKVLGCHSMDSLSDLSAIFAHFVGLFGMDPVEGRMFGRGTGAYLSVLFARTEAWLWKSVASWQPVANLSDWLTHQLKFGPPKEKAGIEACWGLDPEAESVQGRSRSHSLRSNNQGTQDVRHLLWSTVAPPDHPRGWKALQGIKTFNWLVHGTSDRSKRIEVDTDSDVKALLTGSPSSPP
jgi:hypothetical protein